MEVSWIVIIGVAVEKIHDDLQHRFKKAYFFAWYTAKVANPLTLQCLMSLLLGLKSILPCEICLVPVICRCVRKRMIRGRLKRRIYRGLR